MLEAIKNLVDTNLITEDTRRAIEEAWEQRISEERSNITTELREEFAQKYEHDKGQIIESLDKMVQEALTVELSEFAGDKRKLAEERVAVRRALQEHAAMLQTFVVESLAKEIKELHNDRNRVFENFQTLEGFVIKQLSEEIGEFAQDKKALVEAKVKLVNEAKNQFAALRSEFINKSAKAVKEHVSKELSNHMDQFREDIEAARRNTFGRRLFEAFVSEYESSLHNEKTEVARLLKTLATKDQQLAEARKIAEDKQQLVESKEAEIRKVQGRAQREKVLTELTANLTKDKKALMVELLESVQTANLKSAFDKYLPAVLNETVDRKKTVISESSNKTAVTGNKTVNNSSQDVVHITELRKLAGLN